MTYNRILGIPLSQENLRFVNSLLNGQINEIDPEEKLNNLDKIVSQRQLNVEDLGRLNPKKVQTFVQGYKIKKDIYDICCLSYAAKQNNLDIDPKELKKSIDEILAYSFRND